MKTRTALPFVLAALLAGCATTTPTPETSVGYAIYHIKAGPEIGSAKIAEAIKMALQRNTSRVQIGNGIPPSPLPQAAPRFQLMSPLKGSNLGALAAASGQSLQVPTCEGATLSGNKAATAPSCETSASSAPSSTSRSKTWSPESGRSTRYGTLKRNLGTVRRSRLIGRTGLGFRTSQRREHT